MFIFAIIFKTHVFLLLQQQDVTLDLEKSKKKAGITQSSFPFNRKKNSSPGKGPACLYDIFLVQLAEILAAHHRDLSKQASLPKTCDQALPPLYLYTITG